MVWTLRLIVRLDVKIALQVTRCHSDVDSVELVGIRNQCLEVNNASEGTLSRFKRLNSSRRTPVCAI